MPKGPRSMPPASLTAAQPEKIRCSVGITAYNEETNIGHLLAALLDQHLHSVEIAEIIIVASACTDRTVPIVREYMAVDERVRLIEQERREGKTSAINLFLAAALCGVNALTAWWRLPALPPGHGATNGAGAGRGHGAAGAGGATRAMPGRFPRNSTRRCAREVSS